MSLFGSDRYGGIHIPGTNVILAKSGGGRSGFSKGGGFAGGGDPFNDVSGKTIRINYQQPVQAITVETGGAATESLYVNTSNGDVLKPL